MNRTRINALISVGEHIKCSPRATIDTTSPPPLVGRWQPRTAQRRSYEKRAAHEASWQGHEFGAGAAAVLSMHDEKVFAAFGMRMDNPAQPELPFRSVLTGATAPWYGATAPFHGA
jgi:hypothetical protein